MRSIFSFFRSSKKSLVETGGGSAPKKPKTVKRVFNAARIDRLADDWKIDTTSLNEDVRGALVTLRARARDLEQNNSIARRFLKLVETHVIGSKGFKLQIDGALRNGNADKVNNKLIERHFATWAERGVCELTNKYSLADVERLTIRTAARDGELLIRTYLGAATLDNPYGFALEILDPARIDTQKNFDLPTGNKVRLGIELNSSGAAAAYWLFSGEIKNDFGQKGERIPADQIIHAFISDRPEQLRGVPWMAGVMFDIHMLSAYQEAAVTNARIGASKMGFYKTGPDGISSLADDEIDGEFITDAEPGHFSQLPQGYDFQEFNPDYPHQMYAEFTNTIKRDIASGLTVSHHALSGDLTDVNFSSIRSGTLEERENWMVIQNWFSTAVLRTIYHRWLKQSLDVGAFDLALSKVDAFQRYRVHHWQGRRWPWVDPLKDIQTSISAIDNKLKSPQMVANEMGIDVEEMLDEIARYKQMLADRDLDKKEEVGNATE